LSDDDRDQRQLAGQHQRAGDYRCRSRAHGRQGVGHLQNAESRAYSTIVRGVDGTTGVALVEVFDLDRTVDSKLANISTRGWFKRAITL
jgi:hypothetical protein